MDEEQRRRLISLLSKPSSIPEHPMRVELQAFRDALNEVPGIRAELVDTRRGSLWKVDLVVHPFSRRDESAYVLAVAIEGSTARHMGHSEGIFATPEALRNHLFDFSEEYLVHVVSRYRERNAEPCQGWLKVEAIHRTNLEDIAVVFAADRQESLATHALSGREPDVHLDATVLPPIGRFANYKGRREYPFAYSGGYSMKDVTVEPIRPGTISVRGTVMQPPPFGNF